MLDGAPCALELTAPDRDVRKCRVVALVLEEADVAVMRLPHGASMSLRSFQPPHPGQHECPQLMRFGRIRTTALEDPETQLLRFPPAPEMTQRLRGRSFELAAP